MAPDHTVARLSNIWDGGLFLHGFHGFASAFQIAILAFVGIEPIGTTAAEAKDPTVTLPKAVNAIPWRIPFFYLGALATIMAVTPWCQVSEKSSHFAAMFSLAGMAGLRPQAHVASTFRLPGGRWAGWACLVFFVFALWTLTLTRQTRLAVALFPLWLTALALAWVWRRCVVATADV